MKSPTINETVDRLEREAQDAIGEGEALPEFPTVDGVRLVAGDRIIERLETDPREHGVYRADSNAFNVPPTETAPRRVIRIPQDAEFGDTDFIPAPDIESIAAVLINDYRDLAHLRDDCSIVYVWKRKGGQSGGTRTLGKTQKPSGLLRHFSRADYVVTISADHARALGFTERELTALTFHELNHTKWEEDELTGAGRYTLVNHDVEAFAAEIREFGLWKSDLREMAHEIKQLSLDDA